MSQEEKDVVDASIDPRTTKHDGLKSWRGWARKLTRWGVETRGISPVPEEERIDKNIYKIFFVWFSANTNILSFSAGTLGPVAFGLGTRDSCLVILFFNMLCCIPPAYFATWGPQTGMRQMVLARYSFGKYLIALPILFNLVGMTGFCILNAILGGQTLSVVADGNLSWSVGIVIISVLSLVISFCGIKVLTWFERIAWFPVLVVFVVAVGIGGSQLSNVPSPEPASAREIFSFASTIAGFVITYTPLSSDYTTYFRPDVSKPKLSAYTFLGFFLSIATFQCLGAAAAASAVQVPSWSEGYDNSNVGGLIFRLMLPVDSPNKEIIGFAKFLTVLMSLSVTSNMALTFYSFSLNMQTIHRWLAFIPRYLWSVVVTAVVIPLAIVGANSFYDTLTNFLVLIGYWASAYIAIILFEHLIIRGNSFSRYDLASWDGTERENQDSSIAFRRPRQLPKGLGAFVACITAGGLAVLFMDQIWWVGPVAEKTGDIGFEMTFAIAAVIYVPARLLELRVFGR